MSIARFHCPTALAAGTKIALPADTFHHAVRVRRLRVDDSLVLFAGDGSEATAKLVAIRRDGADVAIENLVAVDRESPLEVTLLQGISSGDRMDYTLQKAVELGVLGIAPVAMQRSVPMSGERADKRAAHWRQVVISACEQCGRARIPEVLPVAGLAEALRNSHVGCAVLLSASGTARLSGLARPSGPVAVLAGPEGGLTADEERAAIEAGFTAISLGPRVLRTETAAVAALAIMQSLWGDG